MKIIKIFILLILALITFSSVFSLTLVGERTSEGANQEVINVSDSKGMSGPPIWLFILIIFGSLAVGGIIFGIFYLIYKLYAKIMEDRKGNIGDIEFQKYKSDVKQCLINRNRNYVWPTFYTFWLFKKRAPIYANTGLGKKLVGYYGGHAIKKEGMGYIIFSLYQHISFFKRENDVLIIPYLFKDKIKFHETFEITIDCEGIDETMSSEYFSMCLFLTPDEQTRKKRTFVDYSNELLKTYIEEFVYRDVIKNLASEYKTNIREVTEMNPNIQYGRKKSSDLNN